MTGAKTIFTFTKVSISAGCGATISLKKALTRSLWQLFLLDPWPPNFCRVRRSAPVAPTMTNNNKRIQNAALRKGLKATCESCESWYVRRGSLTNPG